MADHLEPCAEWRDDVAAWALAQITPDREAALDAHLATCAACRAEADELLAVAAVALSFDAAPLAGDEPVAAPAPPELGDRIVTRVRAERRARSARRAVIAGVGAAAAAAVLVTVVAVSGSSGPGRRLEGEHFAFVTVPVGAVVDAVVAPDGQGSQVQLVASGLDPETTYALWLTPPGGTYPDRVAAGTFRPDVDGNVDVILKSAIATDSVGRVWATDLDGVVFDTT